MRGRTYRCSLFFSVYLVVTQREKREKLGEAALHIQMQNTEKMGD